MKKDNVIETFNLLQIDENVKKVFDADISARIPYYLHCCVYNFSREIWVEDDILYNYDLGGNCQTLKLLNERGTCLMYYQIRPYLRPMSSMTEKEKKDILQSLKIHGDIDNEGNLILGVECNIITLKVCKKYLGELNKRMFDVCHMIEKGLGLEAPEGMYNIKEK